MKGYSHAYSGGFGGSLFGFFLTILLAISFSTPANAVEKVKPAVDLTTAIVQVAKRNIPAVVHIEVTGQQEVAVPSLPFDNDPFFRYFFGTPNSPKKYRRETKGMGTGMIIDQQGHILTNHHVVGGATKIEVQLSNGSKYPAKLVGTDPKTDLAVVKISAREVLAHVIMGDSDKVEVGEWVVAIGHPRGLDQTVTQGIISAKHRQGITDPTSYQDFLQTDAAINPGNSGGPLLNLYGQVVGVNTIIISASGGFEGIGLAIPSNMALHISNRLISHGKVERGWLGITVHDVSSEQAKPSGMNAPGGAVVTGLTKGGPSDRAGLKKGDIIQYFRGKEITNAAAFRNEVAIAAIGSDAKMTVLRDGRKQDVTVRIDSPQEANKVLASSVKELLGAEVSAVSQKEASKYGLKANQGVSVAWLDSTGPLGKAGLEVGDIILEIDGQVVEGVKGINEIAGTLRPQQQVILLAVDYRTGKTGYVRILLH